MKHYDPEVAPDPVEWLALDEQERIDLAEAHHLVARIKLPSVKAHAAFHAIVENQIAEGHEPVIRAMTRLTSQGLTRHEAVHAIGSVLADQLYQAVHMKDPEYGLTAQAHYDATVERLSADEWRRKYDQ